MTTEELDARIATAQKAYEATKQRASELHSAAVKARQEATEAASMGEVLLSDAAHGQADVSDDQLLSAADEAKRARAVASIAEAKAAAGLRIREQAQVTLLHADAAALSAKYHRCVGRELGATDEVEAAKALLDQKIAALAAAQKETAAAYAEATHWNQLQLHTGHHRNSLLNAMKPDEKPRVQIPQHYPGAPAIKAELFFITQSGFNRGQQNVVRALSDWRYRDHGRVRSATKKADAAA